MWVRDGVPHRPIFPGLLASICPHHERVPMTHGARIHAAGGKTLALSAKTLKQMFASGLAAARGPTATVICAPHRDSGIATLPSEDKHPSCTTTSVSSASCPLAVSL